MSGGAATPIPGPAKALAVREELQPATPGLVPAGNKILDPDTWAMFAQIANTIAPTDFVPEKVRNNSPAVMACMMYGHALGLHPSVALTEVYIVDGRPGLSAAVIAGKIREAGHRLRRKEIRDADENFLGTTAIGRRTGDVGEDDPEEDEFTFTLEMAARAGLMGKHNWQKYPEAMCWARCVSQLARFLFSDVFLGQAVYTVEELGETTGQDGVPERKEPDGELVEQQTDRAPEPGGAAEGDGADAGAGEGGEDAAADPAVDSAGQGAGDGPAEPGPAPLEPGEQAQLDAVQELVKENMPPVIDAASKAAERGDRGFVQAILDHELKKGDRARARLVTALEGMLETMPQGSSSPEDSGSAPVGSQLGTSPSSDERTLSDPEPQPAGFQPEADPLAEVDAPSFEAKIARQLAACAWLEDQMPQLRHWRREAVIGSAARQFGIQAHSLEDLEEWQLDMIWEAVPEEAKKGLALLSAADLAKLAGVETE